MLRESNSEGCIHQQKKQREVKILMDFTITVSNFFLSVDLCWLYPSGWLCPSDRYSDHLVSFSCAI